jgi:hypothetical protein
VRSKKTHDLPAVSLQLIGLPRVMDTLAETRMKFQTVGVVSYHFIWFWRYFGATKPSPAELS